VRRTEWKAKATKQSERTVRRKTASEPQRSFGDALHQHPRSRLPDRRRTITNEENCQSSSDFDGGDPQIRPIRSSETLGWIVHLCGTLASCLPVHLCHPITRTVNHNPNCGCLIEWLRKRKIPAKRYAIVLSIPAPTTCSGSWFANSPMFGKGSGG